MRGAGTGRRVFQRGPQRRKGLQKMSGGDQHQVGLFRSPATVGQPLWRSLLKRLARACFELTFFTCSSLCLIQIVQYRYTKQYRVAPFRRRVTHFAIWTLFGCSMVRNLWVSIEQAKVKMDLVTLTCIAGFWGQVTAESASRLEL